jgi:hypothetical protein
LRVAASDEHAGLDAAEAQRVCVVWNGTSPLGLRVAGALIHAGARALLLVSEIDAPTAEGALPSAAPPVVIDAIVLAAGARCADIVAQCAIAVAQGARARAPSRCVPSFYARGALVRWRIWRAS